MNVDLKIRGEVSSLRLEPGDRILVTITTARLSPSQLDELKQALEAEFPGHPVTLLQGLSVAKVAA